jgi:hypothetical protein
VTPTRQQKRTWRRRRVRAKYTKHLDRGADWKGGIFVLLYRRDGDTWRGAGERLIWPAWRKDDGPGRGEGEAAKAYERKEHPMRP